MLHMLTWWAAPFLPLGAVAASAPAAWQNSTYYQQSKLVQIKLNLRCIYSEKKCLNRQVSARYSSLTWQPHYASDCMHALHLCA